MRIRHQEQAADNGDGGPYHGMKENSEGRGVVGVDGESSRRQDCEIMEGADIAGGAGQDGGEIRHRQNETDGKGRKVDIERPGAQIQHRHFADPGRQRGERQGKEETRPGYQGQRAAEGDDAMPG